MKNKVLKATHLFLYTSIQVVLGGLLLLILWLGIRCFAFDYFTIPTNSMLPTLGPADKVFVNKGLMGARIYSDFHFTPEGSDLHSWRTKGIRRLQHNDIVVFNFPHHQGRINFVINNVYCKRIIALPGDSISVKNGFYHNNNFHSVLGIQAEQERFSLIPDSIFPPEVVNTIPYDDHFSWTIKNFGPFYIPRKGDIIPITPVEGTLYKMLLEWELGDEVTIDWETNRVYSGKRPLNRHEFTHNYYFMAGDNVTDSNDSRYWGLVPEEYIVGIVGYVYHPNKF